MTDVDAVWLPAVLARYGVGPSFSGDRQTNDAGMWTLDKVAGVLPFVPADRRIWFLDEAARDSRATDEVRELTAALRSLSPELLAILVEKAAGTAAFPETWTLADALVESGQPKAGLVLYDGTVAQCDDPDLLCEFGSLLLQRCGSSYLPLTGADFEGFIVVGDDMLSAMHVLSAAPTRYVGLNLPFPVHPIPAELARIAVRAYGKAWTSVYPLTADPDAALSWEAALLGLFALDGLCGTFATVEDYNGTVAALIYLEDWSERVLDRYSRAADSFLGPFEIRLGKIRGFLEGRLGLKIGDAIEIDRHGAVVVGSNDRQTALLLQRLNEISASNQRQEASQRRQEVTVLPAILGLAAAMDEKPGDTSAAARPPRTNPAAKIQELGPPAADLTVADYIGGGENDTVEFKQSLRWDHRRSAVNKDLEKVAARTIAAFMNSRGGSLIIGVADDKLVCGIEADLASFAERKRDRDQWELHLRAVLDRHLGKLICARVKVRFETVDDKTVAVLRIVHSHGPVWLTDGDVTEFHIRSGNSTRHLDSKAAYEYILAHFDSA